MRLNFAEPTPSTLLLSRRSRGLSADSVCDPAMPRNRGMLRVTKQTARSSLAHLLASPGTAPRRTQLFSASSFLSAHY